jgi:S1-C subfamily serine protease
MSGLLLFEEVNKMSTYLRVMRTGSLLCLLFLAGSSVSAQQGNPQPSPTPNPGEEKIPELNTILMESTFKLIGNGSIGTAFVIGRESVKNPEKSYYVLVTAAHVLEQSTGDEVALVLRMKNKDTYVRMPVRIRVRENGKPLWTKHPQADVAVMYIALPEEAHIPLLPSSVLASDEMLDENHIHPGDSLLCLGYPNGVEANDAGFAVLRSGRIASYPILPTKMVKKFLVDFNVFDGNSGGPVYFVEANRLLAPRSIRVGMTQFILGVVSEEIYATREPIPNVTRPKESLRLAIVIHASLIREAIDSLPTLDK